MTSRPLRIHYSATSAPIGGRSRLRETNGAKPILKCPFDATPQETGDMLRFLHFYVTANKTEPPLLLEEPVLRVHRASGGQTRPARSHRYRIEVCRVKRAQASLLGRWKALG